MSIPFPQSLMNSTFHSYRQIVLLLLMNALAIPMVFGQVKYEKEYRIRKDEVPAMAGQFVSAIDFAKRVKWYYEENFTGHSIEAKFKADGYPHSIEFDTTGMLEDIEIGRAWKELPVPVQRQIDTSLQSDFMKYKISKIQIQYQGGPQSLLAFLNSGKLDPGEIMIRYELILRGKVDGIWQLFEKTFDASGHPVRTEVILPQPSDHLEY